MKTYKFIDGMHACMILSSNAPNDLGPEYVLADDAKDIYKSGRDKGWSAGYHEGQVELASCISAKDARIAELTADLKVADRAALELAAEVARLTGLADGMYRSGDALLLSVDTFIATYGSEDVELEDLHELIDADAAMCEAMEPYEAEYIARNALKEGE